MLKFRYASSPRVKLGLLLAMIAAFSPLTEAQGAQPRTIELASGSGPASTRYQELQRRLARGGIRGM